MAAHITAVLRSPYDARAGILCASSRVGRGLTSGCTFGQTWRVVEVPRTKYVAAPDGSQIAYQVIGDRALDLVYLTGELSNVDMRWEDAAGLRFLEGLASFSRVIVFDRRGLGASDRLPTGAVPTWEEWAEDLTAVMDAAHSERAALLAVGHGGHMAITFAATHPERVRALILFNSLGSPPGFDGDPATWADFAADFDEQF